MQQTTILNRVEWHKSFAYSAVRFAEWERSGPYTPWPPLQNTFLPRRKKQHTGRCSARATLAAATLLLRIPPSASLPLAGLPNTRIARQAVLVYT